MIDARDFGRLEGKVDMVLANQTVQRETSDDHEDRISRIERDSAGWQGRILGGAAVLGVIGGLLAKVLF